MPAVEPKILCGSCGKEILFLALRCTACGADVQWPPEFSSKRQMPQARQGVSKQVRIVVLLAVAAAGIFLYEILMEKPAGSTQRSAAASIPGAGTQDREGINSLERAIAANPNDSESILHLANMFHDDQMFDKAVDYYLRYLAQKPEDADARVDLGVCYKETGNLEKARKEMSEALHYNPKHQLAHFNLGIVALSENNLQESNEWFRKTIALGPGTEIGQRASQILNQHNQQSLQKN